MEIKKKLQGVFTALLTPYDKDGKINDKSLNRVVDFNLKNGINGFYVGGSTGEGVLMSTEERKELFTITKEVNMGRGVLIGHVGSTSTQEAIELAKEAKKLGYDAVSAVAPFYYGHSYEAVKNYYKDIADASDLPVVIYNFPLSGSFSLNKEKAMDLLDDKRIVAIKHTSQDLFMLEQFKSLKNPPVVFNGYDEMLAAGLIMGADGGIGSTYNFMPHRISELYRLFKAGDLPSVMKKQKEINFYISCALKASENFGMINAEKEILTQMGIEMGYAKKPFVAMDDNAKKQISVISKELRREVKELI